MKVRLARTYGVSPVSEADSFMVRCAAGSNNNSDNDQAQETEDLDRCGNDFSLAEEFYIQQIDRQDCGKTDSDDDRWGQISPVTDHDCCCRDFRGNGNCVAVSVRNGQSKSESRVYEASCKMRERTSSRELCIVSYLPPCL
jgi:hypothetical protein